MTNWGQNSSDLYNNKKFESLSCEVTPLSKQSINSHGLSDKPESTNITLSSNKTLSHVTLADHIPFNANLVKFIYETRLFTDAQIFTGNKPSSAGEQLIEGSDLAAFSIIAEEIVGESEMKLLSEEPFSAAIPNEIVKGAEENEPSPVEAPLADNNEPDNFSSANDVITPVKEIPQLGGENGGRSEIGGDRSSSADVQFIGSGNLDACPIIAKEIVGESEMNLLSEEPFSAAVPDEIVKGAEENEPSPVEAPFADNNEPDNFSSANDVITPVKEIPQLGGENGGDNIGDPPNNIKQLLGEPDMYGKIFSIQVKVGNKVVRGQELYTVEVMKCQPKVFANCDMLIIDIFVNVDQYFSPEKPIIGYVEL